MRRSAKEREGQGKRVKETVPRWIWVFRTGTTPGQRGARYSWMYSSWKASGEAVRNSLTTLRAVKWKVEWTGTWGVMGTSSIYSQMLAAQGNKGFLSWQRDEPLFLLKINPRYQLKPTPSPRHIRLSERRLLSRTRAILRANGKYNHSWPGNSSSRDIPRSPRLPKIPLPHPHPAFNLFQPVIRPADLIHPSKSGVERIAKQRKIRQMKCMDKHKVMRDAIVGWSDEEVLSM